MKVINNNHQMNKNNWIINRLQGYFNKDNVNQNDGTYRNNEEFMETKIW